jgi:hypothetical protein
MPEPIATTDAEALRASPTLPTRGALSLFGFPSTEATLEVLPRSPAWRASRGLAFLLGGVVLAPAVGLLPPHVPWATAAVITGGFFGFRKWREHFTVLSVEGSCPKCGALLRLSPGTPLRRVSSIPCEGCNHDSRLTVSDPFAARLAGRAGKEEAGL